MFWVCVGYIPVITGCPNNYTAHCFCDNDKERLAAASFVHNELQNYVVIGLGDQNETPPNWWEDHGQWEASDLATDQWVTLTYNLTEPASGGNVGDLTKRVDLDMVFIGFGGGNHTAPGTCYIRNLKFE